MKPSVSEGARDKFLELAWYPMDGELGPVDESSESALVEVDMADVT